MQLRCQGCWPGSAIPDWDSVCWWQHSLRHLATTNLDTVAIPSLCIIQRICGGEFMDGKVDPPWQAKVKLMRAFVLLFKLYVVHCCCSFTLHWINRVVKLSWQDTAILDSLTGIPMAEDILLFCVPVCAPYSALSNYRYAPSSVANVAISLSCLQWMYLASPSINIFFTNGIMSLSHEYSILSCLQLGTRTQRFTAVFACELRPAGWPSIYDVCKKPGVLTLPNLDVINGWPLICGNSSHGSLDWDPQTVITRLNLRLICRQWRVNRLVIITCTDIRWSWFQAQQKEEKVRLNA